MKFHAQHHNALDLLRLAAAWMVLFSHQFDLMLEQAPLWLSHYSWGQLGVGIFFFLSGGLVWGSWQRDPHLGRFFARRCLRIFPGLLVVVLLTVLVLGPVMSSLRFNDYWMEEGTWRYLKTLLLNNQKGLPGVFEDNPLPVAVNGSLWSLGPEFLAYVILAIVGSCCRYWRRDLAPAVLLVTMSALLALYIQNNGQSKQHLEVLVLFGWGAWWAHWRSQRQLGVAMSWPGLVLVLLALSGNLFLNGGFERLILLLNIIGLVYFGYRLSWGHALLTKLGDMSYGVYIYAFPVQQSLIQVFPEWRLGAHLLAATALTFMLAWVSWHGVEKIALRFKPAIPPVGS